MASFLRAIHRSSPPSRALFPFLLLPPHPTSPAPTWSLIRRPDAPPQPLLPYANADRTLRALAAAAEVVGRRAIGVLHAALHHVTSLQDDVHNTLREACRAKEPLWIVFGVSGTIYLDTYLRVSSHKTTDARGQQVKLTGKGLQLKDCHHVIVCNLEFEAGRGHDVDGIQIEPAMAAAAPLTGPVPAPARDAAAVRGDSAAVRLLHHASAAPARRLQRRRGFRADGCAGHGILPAAAARLLLHQRPEAAALYSLFLGLAMKSSFSYPSNPLACLRFICPAHGEGALALRPPW